MIAIKNKFLLFLRALTIFMMLAHALGSTQAVSVVHAAGVVTVPSGLNPGDQYRLIFVTTGTRDATSMNIADYNAFVTAQANAVPALSILNTTWTAVVNVATVSPYDYVHYIDAMDNTQTNPSVSTGVSIYGLDGLKIADNNADLWDNSIDNRITDQNGAVVNKNVWTGQFGTNGPLGCLCGQGQGNPYYTNSIWAAYPIGYSATIALPFYAISGVLTVPLPNAPTALRFAGTTTGSYVSVPDDPALILTTNFTIEADVKWDGTLGLSTIVSKPRQDAGSPGTGYAVGLIDGQPIIYLSVIGTPVNRNLVAPTALMPNVWTHLEFAYTGTQEFVWVDGTQVANVTYPTSASVNRVSPTNLLIGREFLLGLTDRAFHGDIDNVRISNGVQPGALTTVAFYPFQEGSGLTTADMSGNGHNGTLSSTNTPTWIAPTVAIDTDADGVPDATDNCPAVANASQTNTDGDSLGDACDTDDDGDGVLDVNDAFPLNAAESVDTDSDGIGNNADADDDNDGVLDVNDAFPLDTFKSLDTDGNSTGNNADEDDDGDGVLDVNDAFPLNKSESVDTDDDSIGNNADTDDDNDGVLDVDDVFPLDAAESADNDSDGIGDNADTDDDNDGVLDINDAFPFDAGELADSDGDGIGDNADTDDDNDGVLDVADAFPFNPNETVDSDGDGIGDNADTDDDNDGVADAADAFPNDPAESLDTDQDGIGNNADEDDDNDTVLDTLDAFPLNPTESVDTDNDGVGNNADTDDDGDGVEDANDAFPLNPAESMDSDGDGIGNNADPDDDNDGILDAVDTFPLDPTESADMDGDGIGNNTDTDDDGDGVLDVNDAFPLNANESVDTDGDGVGNNADPDDDGDGVNDANDACSLTSGSGSDADGNGCTDTITAQTSLIQSFHLQGGTQTSLLAKVNSAIAMLSAGDNTAAINSLNALINETRAQRGKKIPAPQADVLIAFAQNVIAGLQ